MAKALSEDLRERVIRAIEAGASCREAAKRFGVSASSAVKWHRRWREMGALAPGKVGNPGGRKLAPHRELILGLIEAEPDVTLHQLRQRLADHGVTIGFGSIWRFLDDEGISFKKKRCWPPSRSVTTSPEPAPAGMSSSPGSTPIDWSSSTRPGRRRT